MKKKDFFKGVERDLRLGLKGLRVSLYFLIGVVFVLLVFLLIQGGLFELGRDLFRLPRGEDYIALFGFSILFVAIPFFVGVKVGLKSRG